MEGGGFGSASSPAGAASGGKTAVATAKASHVTGPVKAELLEQLTRTEFTEAPRWETWSNHVSGEWVGVYSAFTPWAGLPEPVWMDERGKYLDTVLSRCLEERGRGLAGGGREGVAAPEQEELLLRTVARATSPAELKEVILRPPAEPAADRQAAGDQAAQPAQQQQQQEVKEEVEEEDEEGSFEVEALTFNSQGVVMFDGGHYSAGPDYIGVPQFKMLQEEEGEAEQVQGEGEQAGAGEGDVMAPAPTTTSIVETCLVDPGTQTRMRLKLTLRIGHHPETEEVQVEVLRVLLFREHWAGPPGLTTPQDIQGALTKLATVPAPAAGMMGAAAAGTSSRPANTADIKLALRDATLLPRADPRAWAGRWSVFTVTATGLEESEPVTGEPVVTWVYQTNEDAQQWHVPDGPPDEEDDTGGCIWLPGGLVVSFTMEEEEEEEEEEEGEGDGASEDGRTGSSARGAQPPPRCLRLGLSWALPVGNQVLSMERGYDGKGVLRGVRLSTAVKGGWVGGTM